MVREEVDILDTYRRAGQAYKKAGLRGCKSAEEFHINLKSPGAEAARGMLAHGIYTDSKLGLVPAPEEAFNDLLLMLWACVTWLEYGSNVFTLTESLSAALLLTEIKGITEEDLRLPFPCFMIRLPLETLPIHRNSEDPKEWASVISVHEFQKQDVRWVRLVAFSESSGLECNINYPLKEILENRAIIDVLRNTWAEPDIASVIEDKTTQLGMQKIVVNLLMWLRSTGGMISKTPEWRSPKNRERAKQEGLPTTWVMGREVKLSRELRDYAKDRVCNPRLPPKFSAGAKHIVRGHYKPKVAARTGKEFVWVEPYWRNLDAAVSITHTYTNTEKDSHGG